MINQPNENAIEEIKQAYDIKMKALLNKYEEEVKNKEKLKEDIDKLKLRYENSNAGNGNANKENVQCNINEQKESVLKAMEKLKEIENQMVGGEKANDVELKEKRARKKRVADAKMNAISEALSNLNDDDNILLKAYGDITEELKAKSMLMKKAKRKIQSLEQEVDDIQSEFESERTDYLETIRRLNEQIRLLSQILDKVQPLIKNECNYSNINKIKEEAILDDNTQQWILPNVTLNRVRLPPALKHINEKAAREFTPSKLYRSDSPNNYIFDSDIIESPVNDHEMNDYNNGEDKLLRKLENSHSDDIVNNYLMPKRRQQLLNTLHKLKLSESNSGGHFQFYG